MRRVICLFTSYHHLVLCIFHRSRSAHCERECEWMRGAAINDERRVFAPYTQNFCEVFTSGCWLNRISNFHFLNVDSPRCPIPVRVSRSFCRRQLHRQQRPRLLSRKSSWATRMSWWISTRRQQGQHLAGTWKVQRGKIISAGEIPACPSHFSSPDSSPCHTARINSSSIDGIVRLSCEESETSSKRWDLMMRWWRGDLSPITESLLPGLQRNCIRACTNGGCYHLSDITSVRRGQTREVSVCNRTKNNRSRHIDEAVPMGRLQWQPEAWQTSCTKLSRIATGRRWRYGKWGRESFATRWWSWHFGGDELVGWQVQVSW